MSQSDQIPVDPRRNDHQPAGGRTRHVSIRVPHDLYQRLERCADDQDETVSQAARRILSEGLAPPGRDAIDDAISALLTVRRQLPHHDDSAHATPHETRSVNILNAKTDLQRLIEEVGRGAEIIITHAGAQRARLVPVVSPRATHQPDRNS